LEAFGLDESGCRGEMVIEIGASSTTAEAQSSSVVRLEFFSPGAPPVYVITWSLSSREQGLKREGKGYLGTSLVGSEVDRGDKAGEAGQ
jgi:hypothetical protein